MQDSQKGFTLVELMLAMTFVSLLLLSIALVSIQVGKIYAKGETLRKVNRAGREVGDILKRDFLQSKWSSSIRGNDEEGDEVVLILQEAGKDISGRFCLGSYSYAWNMPETIDVEVRGPSVVVDSDGVPVSFVRIVDPGGGFCQTVDGVYPNEVDSGAITHLLRPQEDGEKGVLVVHSLNISPVAVSQSGTDGLFNISYKLGTSAMSEINTIDQTCKPPTDNEANFDFCAINEFNMIVRTNG